MIVESVPPKLLSTGEAAKQLGISRYSLHRWWSEGMVTPEYVTPGGQARWDLENLKQQLRDLRQPEE